MFLIIYTSLATLVIMRLILIVMLWIFFVDLHCMYPESSLSREQDIISIHLMLTSDSLSLILR